MSSASNPVSSSSLATMSSFSPYQTPEISKGATPSVSSDVPSEKSSNAGTQLTPNQLTQEIENLKQNLSKITAMKDDLQNEVAKLTKQLQNTNSALEQYLQKMAQAMLENAKLKTKLRDQQLEIENLRTTRVYSVSGHSVLLDNEIAKRILEQARGWVP